MLTPVPSFRFEVRKDASCFLLPLIVDGTMRSAFGTPFILKLSTNSATSGMSRVGTIERDRAIRLPGARGSAAG